MSAVTSASGILSKTVLFEARKDGYRTCRIPGIVVTPRGTVLAYCESRLGRGSDWDAIDIRLRRSTDGGRTWEPARMVVDHQPFGERPLHNFVLIPDRDTNRIHALFGHDYRSAYHMVSDDEGETFSAPRDISAAFLPFQKQYPWRVLGIGPGHGIQLRNGRMLVPVWLSPGTGVDAAVGRVGHRPNRCATLASDDHGETWRGGEMVPDTFPNCNEAEAVELADGTVLLNMRNMDLGGGAPEEESLRRAVTVSPDGLGDWSTPRRDPALLEPICFGSICRVSWPEEGESRIVFANPHTLDRQMAGWACDRKNLSVKLSRDECATWSANRVLEAGPSGYSDVAVLPDKTILCFYECGMIDHMADTANLTLARFDAEWIAGGEHA